MNLQEIFNKVVVHLRTQGEQSRNVYGCAYRGDNDTKCAVGCLIKDEHYREGLEGCSVSTPSVQFALAKSGVSVNDKTLRLLKDVQSVHDHMDPPFWEDCFQRIARETSLTLP